MQRLATTGVSGVVTSKGEALHAVKGETHGHTTGCIAPYAFARVARDVSAIRPAMTIRLKERKRIRSKPHPSATAYLKDMYEKTWKDTQYGVVLWCSGEAGELLKKFVESPFGRVPKMLPHRTMSGRAGRSTTCVQLTRTARRSSTHLPCSRGTNNWHAYPPGGVSGAPAVR